MADQAAAPAPAVSRKSEDPSSPAVEVRATTADATTDGVAAAPKEENPSEPASEGEWHQKDASASHCIDAVSSLSAKPTTDEAAPSATEDPATSDKDGDNAEDKGVGQYSCWMGLRASPPLRV